MGTATARILAPSPWWSVVRAMSQTGGASLLSGVLSMLATKIIAVTLGPAHVATLSTLQQLRQAAVTGSTLTGQTALVQGASSSTGQIRREFLRTVLCLMTAATVLIAATFLLAPAWIAQQAGLPAGQQHLIAWLGIATVLAAVYVFASALLNATGAIGSLATVQLAAPAAMAVLAYPVALQVPAHDTWLVGLLAAASLVAVFAATRALYQERAEIAGWLTGPGAWLSTSAVRKFFAISGAMFLSGAFSSWALLAVRARILHTEGLVAGGQFDAAWAISMNQAGLVLASMQTYYLPALARATNPTHRSAHIERVLTVAAIAATALIVGLIVLRPQVLSTLYSAQFAGASQYLRWTLAGDYLKISSWILSIPLIASANMRVFLGADLSAYGAFAAASFLLSRWLTPAESASVAFVIMYAVHLAYCGIYLWRSGDFRPQPQTIAVWIAGLALVTLTSAIFWSHA
jgi:O-antigen/teichoic acid export membrane protein